MPAASLNNQDHDLELECTIGSFDVNSLIVHNHTIPWAEVPGQNGASVSEGNSFYDTGDIGELSNIKVTNCGVNICFGAPSSKLIIKRAK
ncbi:unnamed protein product [Cuscuta epithymum]|uniref:Polygalacturonase n=1 Tax=Cuscuta epithymum TaxID=186058 RepID=A0AAV0F458_9ASTE|nr:unnamed protein product [Cuscuta epithymum]